MHNKKTKNKLLLVPIATGLLLAGGIIGFIFQDNLKLAATETRASTEQQDAPKFMFDTAKFPDWATTGNVHTNPNDITDTHTGNKDNWSISSISIHQCESGGECNKLAEKCEPWADDKPSCKELARKSMRADCFVMAFYNERKIDPAEEVTKYIAHNKSFGSMSIQEAGIKTLTIKTPEGSKDYTLHYYDYKDTGGDTIMRGNAIGYVSLSSGHIDVRSICSETNQLDETLPVLSAISLEK